MTEPEPECKSDKNWIEFRRWALHRLEEMTRPMDRTYILAVVSEEVFYDLHTLAYATDRACVLRPNYENKVEEFETPFCRLRLEIGEAQRLRVMKFKKTLD